jgi:hypothetical protein
MIQVGYINIFHKLIIANSAIIIKRFQKDTYGCSTTR